MGNNKKWRNRKGTEAHKKQYDSEVKKFYNDNYENLFTGWGNRSDHTAALTPSQGVLLPDVALSNIYTSDGLGNKIITRLSHDMVKNGYRVKGDTEGVIHDELKRLKNKEHMELALNWMRTFGGAITVVGARDGAKLDKPVRKNVKGIDWMRTMSRTRIMVRDEDLIRDVRNPDFGDYEFYHIQFGATNNGAYEKVHRSRCLVYKGSTAPDDPYWNGDNELKYWGLSCLQAPWDQLKQLGGSFQGIAHLMMELVIGKYKFKDLSTMLQGQNSSWIRKRLELINQSKSLINGVVLDQEEDYIRDMVNVSGSDKILEQLMIMVSAATGYPVTVLFGRSPDGMNATGESDMSNYDATIESSQETKLEGPQQKLIKMINSYKNVSGIAEDPVISFNPVRTPSAKERVDIRKTQSETDINYINSGVLSSEQVTEMRFGGGYDPDNMDTEDLLKNPKPSAPNKLPEQPVSRIDREE